MNRFGFELEFVSPTRSYVAIENMFYKYDSCFEVIHPDLINGEWDINKLAVNFGYDSSIRCKVLERGVELRCGVFALDELDKLKKLFQFLDELGNLYVNKSCGLHIHVSNKHKIIDADKIRKLSIKEAKRAHCTRASYTDWNLPTSNSHSSVTQRGESRVEFRWFNASINFRYICKMIRLADYYVNLVLEEKANETALTTS